MLSYILLLVTAIASSPELSTPELPLSDDQEQIVQEIITTFAQTEDLIAEDIIAAIETPEPLEKKLTVVAALPITITNAIEPDMLKYKHWTGTYSPESFIIQINETEIAQGAQHTFPAETSTISLTYSYSFMNGMRTGTKTVSYKLNEQSTQAAITFSWKNDPKILLDNGTLLPEITA